MDARPGRAPDLRHVDLPGGRARRPAWSPGSTGRPGPSRPLAALFAVPALGLGYDSGVLSFACLALGYLAVLVADGLNRASAWNRGPQRRLLARRLVPDERDGHPGRRRRRAGRVARRGSARRAGRRAGAGARGAAADDQPARPRPRGRASAGTGRCSSPTRASTSSATSTSRPTGSCSATPPTSPAGSTCGWPRSRSSRPPASATPRSGSTPGTTLSEPPGYSGQAPALRTTRITSVDFSSQYLPAPYAARSFTAAGDWSYNSESLTIVNSENRADVLTNLSYEVRSWDIAPTAAELARSGAGSPSDGDVTGAGPAGPARSP